MVDSLIIETAKHCADMGANYDVEGTKRMFFSDFNAVYFLNFFKVLNSYNESMSEEDFLRGSNIEDIVRYSVDAYIGLEPQKYSVEYVSFNNFMDTYYQNYIESLLLLLNKGCVPNDFFEKIDFKKVASYPVDVYFSVNRKYISKNLKPNDFANYCFNCLVESENYAKELLPKVINLLNENEVSNKEGDLASTLPKSRL